MSTTSIEYMHICDYAFQANGKHSMIGVFERINSFNFPAAHPYMAVAIKLRDQAHRKFQVSVMVAKPNGDKIAELQAEIATTDDGSAYMDVNLINLQFPEPGRYLVKVLSAGETLISQSLVVAKMAAPSVQKVS
jgi:hypothetical protein